MKNAQSHAAEFDGHQWYSIRGLARHTGKTTQTVRNWMRSTPPMVVMQESGGVKFYRLADDVTIIKGGSTASERGE